ncbi:HAMP domain-containing sensor histidine kinase [Longispora sp. NPDC051575]|uniref:sensor histidine kinase n=1 Tax=Longispora sp. NPDC051575 TaxID=3154943 RepID=UPI003429B281
MLTLARGESTVLDRRPADLADAARSAARELAEEAQAAGVRITLTTAPAPVKGDPALLRQVALNLLANAIRHNHADGTVEMSTGQAENTSYLEVTNTGPALDPHEIPALFEPFHRGRERGLGLGLAIVEAIITTHHGMITATSRTGGGLITRVQLPGRHRGRTAPTG